MFEENMLDRDTRATAAAVCNKYESAGGPRELRHGAALGLVAAGNARAEDAKTTVHTDWLAYTIEAAYG
jgi:hypothetical protein